MTKQQIIDYVMETPQNTNPAILSQMLDEVAGEGGGESSDLSTAQVTVNFIDGAEGIKFQNGSSIKVVEENAGHALVTFYYSNPPDDYIPLNELGIPTQINVPIYKNYPSDIANISFADANDVALVIDVTNSTVVSGNAEITQWNEVLIKGACELNIKLTS